MLIAPLPEGVETDAQVAFLKKIDCAAVQGYYYDRPMPRDRFEDRLIEKRVYQVGWAECTIKNNDIKKADE